MSEKERERIRKCIKLKSACRLREDQMSEINVR